MRDAVTDAGGALWTPVPYMTTRRALARGAPKVTPLGNQRGYATTAAPRVDDEVIVFGPGLDKLSMFADRVPWFHAKDVCDALGLKHTVSAMRRVPEHNRVVLQAHTPGGTQGQTFVSEAGFYRLVLRSDSPRAEARRKR